MSNTEKIFCRLCAQPKPQAKLFDLMCDSVKFKETISKLMHLNAMYVDMSKTNPLPKTICFVCYDLLEKAYDFLLGVQRAQNTLKDIFVSDNDVKLEILAKEDANSSVGHVELDDPSLEINLGDDKKLIFPLVKPELPDGDSQSTCTYDRASDTACSDYELLTKKRRKSKRKKKKSERLIDEQLQRLLSVDTTLDTLKNELVYDVPLADVTNPQWSGYPWFCSLCCAQFLDINTLRAHSMKVHNTCYAFKCVDCDHKQTSYDEFVSHVKRHRKYLRLCCHYCDARFPTADTAKEHIEDCISNRFHACAGCGDTFVSAQENKAHRSEYYRVKTKRRHRSLEEPLSEADLTCQICQKLFKSRSNLQVHMQIHSERRREHTCEKCGKTFFNKGTLTSHMLLHEELRPYKCEICNAAFKTSTQLRSHVGIHGGPRPYSCEQCGRSFRLRCHLKSHLIIHTDSMPHICEYCSKAFRFKTILTQHLRQHTGAKPYSCEQCSRDFTNWPNYNKHMKRRHGMDMAKKKHTPDGVFPVNPLTGQLLALPDSNITEEWKKKIMTHKKPGRPKTGPHRDETQNIAASEQKVCAINVATSITSTISEVQ